MDRYNLRFQYLRHLTRTVGGSHQTGFIEKRETLTDYLRLIDRDTTGNRCDVTPLFADPEAFSRLLNDLIQICAGIEFEQVVAIDALGFILGTGIAVRTQKGLIVLRKAGKLPVQTDVEEFVDYTGQEKSLEMRSD